MSKQAMWVNQFFKLVENENEKTQLKPGNSKGAVSIVRGRHFQFTLNQIENYEKLYNHLTKYSTLKYIVAAIETAPTTGHKHIHIYVQYSQPKILKISDLCGAHVEICRGTPKQNRDYIIKDGNILNEEGEFKSNGGFGGRSIRDVIEMTDDETLDLDYKYYNVIKKIRDDYNRLDINNHYKDGMVVLYIYGSSEIGKSKYGYEAIKKLLNKFAVPGALDCNYDEVQYKNNFWIGCNKGCRFCIYDDFRDSDCKPHEFIKFIDYNKHVLNIKGGQMINEYKYIVITSTQAPWELWMGSHEEKKQWLRRMVVFTIEDKVWKKIDVKDYYELI